jgi:hypothetical protein
VKFRSFLVTPRAHLIKYFFQEQWFLLIHAGEKRSTEWSEFQKIFPPDDRSWADPFLIHHNGRYYVFFEEYLFENKKGHISVLEVNKDGCLLGTPRRILEENYHLSYPYVFQWEGDYYMVPESAANKDIRLYKSVEFPHQWRFESNLMCDLTASDTSLFHHENHWWLFTSIGGDSSRNKNLFLFFSDRLGTEGWKSHPLNPIISDVRRARGAGKIFNADGKIFRPSQNCRPGYGYGFNINEISVLTETSYSEKVIHSVKPLWDSELKGIHSYNSEGDMTIIDGCRRTRRRD